MTKRIFRVLVLSAAVVLVLSVCISYAVFGIYFSAQNERINDFLKARKDDDLGCMFFDDSLPNDQGPFYSARLWPRVHHTMGGLEINDRAQVYDACHRVIPGLYAAGEVTGGVHGQVRLGTVAVADCIIFGRTAARSALEDGVAA